MSTEVHIVKAGDTLWKVSKEYKVSINELILLNPELRKNPGAIRIGQRIRLTKKPKEATAKTNRVLKMEFDGRQLMIYSENRGSLMVAYPAISGLPPKAPHVQELIDAGRTDLDINTDYTMPKYQNVKDAGPIQEDDYILRLKKGMPYDKSSVAGDGAGWGVGGWILTENTLAKLGNFFGGRFGFFIHHDGGSRGTSGCIGLKYAHHMQALRILLVKAYNDGQTEIDVIVKYKNK